MQCKTFTVPTAISKTRMQHASGRVWPSKPEAGLGPHAPSTFHDNTVLHPQDLTNSSSKPAATATSAAMPRTSSSSTTPASPTAITATRPSVRKYIRDPLAQRHYVVRMCSSDDDLGRSVTIRRFAALLQVDGALHLGRILSQPLDDRTTLPDD